MNCEIALLWALTYTQITNCCISNESAGPEPLLPNLLEDQVTNRRFSCTLTGLPSLGQVQSCSKDRSVFFFYDIRRHVSLFRLTAR